MFYYRIQPAGKEIKGYCSQTSAGEIADGLHAFKYPYETYHTFQGFAAWEDYGDEIVVVEAEDDWNNEDVEGVCIDPETAKIVARYSTSEWFALWKNVISREFPEVLEEIKRPGDFFEQYELIDFDDAVAEEVGRGLKK